MRFSERKKKALRAAKAVGADSFLITHPVDIRYLCGFTGSSGALALHGGRTRLFTDGRYREQAATEAVGTRVIVEAGPAAHAAVRWLVEEGDRCAFDAVHMSVASLEALRAALPAGRQRSFLVASTGVIAALREVKDEEEIGLIRTAAALGCRLFDEVLKQIVPGTTEAEVALMLESKAIMAGAEAMSFPTIVAAGGRSSLPHGRASTAKLPRRGLVTLDFGVVLDGYCSDMTRTVSVGRPQREARAMYDSVLEAQLAAVAAVRSGARSGDVDEAARSVLRRAGLEKHFVHSTGHGVGLEIHEGPRLAAKQESLLKAGMVVTIEPGAYLPGRFGVRIEDMVLVTKDGGEILTPTTKTLIEL